VPRYAFVWIVVEIAVVLLAAFGLLMIVALAWATWDEWRSEGDDDLRLGEDGDDLRGLAATLELRHDWWNMTPETLEALPEFRMGVEVLADDDTPVDEAVALSKDADGWVASMALAALAERDDVPDEWVAWATRNIPRSSNCEDVLLLQALARHATAPVVGPALGALDSVRPEHVARFVRSRLDRGERLDGSTFRGFTVEDAEKVESFLDRFEDDLGPELREAFEAWRALRNLTDAGRMWEAPFDRPATLLVGRRRELVERVVSALEESPPRSVLLVGEHGVGKTALARAALDRLGRRPAVFETTAAQLTAGTVYVGELEGRVKALVASLAGQDVVWVLPELQETLFAGQHSRSPQGLLDALLPHVEAGRITLVAEATPTAAELTASARPRVRSAFEIVRLRPLDEEDAIAVARHALEEDALGVDADDETLREAFELAQQFLPTVAPPGNLLRLLHATAAEAAEQGVERFQGRDVLATLAPPPGLPLVVLDPEAPLDLREISTFFEHRVLEQPEAVECVVERIAMIKAGLTDPTRPLAVLLFVGPTGTGKTEIAKALAEFLFGSSERLVRLDMSEYQTPESLDRLLSDTTTERRGATLVSSIRKDPFAVVLLDEFEKAAQPIWDLFLQVFDDGRLTDLQGRVVDFRRSVIVLTSNLGSSVAQGPGVGFDPDERTFSEAGIERAVRRSFRPEFLNRLDRIVVFRPFERSAMRQLLDKELDDALARRGLRSRPWAVELDDSAYAFLVEKGFSPALGARPLKRALERYLLAPIAAAIVEQSVPEGDQFLFATATDGERIEVRFVDPDAEPEPEDAPEGGEPRAPDLRALARSAAGDEGSVRLVLGELARILDAVAELQQRKGHALSVVSEPGFWDRPDRFEILREAEYLDRLDAATRTAERLGARLERSVRQNGQASTELVRLLANRLHVLDRAVAGLGHDAPTDVLLVLETQGGPEAEPFAAVLVEMYSSWARRRGMSLVELDAPPGRHVLAVSGLGCGEILAPEAGVHLLERVDGEHEGSRIVGREQVRVDVLARPAGHDESEEALVRTALEATWDGESTPTVVRRYRPGRAPLVRDGARGYRTGRLDRVLAGDFDLY